MHIKSQKYYFTEYLVCNIQSKKHNSSCCFFFTFPSADHDSGAVWTTARAHCNSPNQTLFNPDSFIQLLSFFSNAKHLIRQPE